MPLWKVLADVSGDVQMTLNGVATPLAAGGIASNIAAYYQPINRARQRVGALGVKVGPAA